MVNDSVLDARLSADWDPEAGVGVGWGEQKESSEGEDKNSECRFRSVMTRMRCVGEGQSRTSSLPSGQLRLVATWRA